MAANDDFVGLEDWWGSVALSGEHDVEAVRGEIEKLMAGMDPESRDEISELLVAGRPKDQNRRRYTQLVLRLAKAMSTKWFHAPDMPTTDKSLLAPISGGYDIYDQDNYNKVVTVLVGKKKSQAKFTVIAGALAAEAEFFRPLCDDRWKCGRDRVISLEDYFPATFGIFITWLYTRDCNMSDTLTKLVPVSSGYFSSHERKSSHKARWHQLLLCYLLADYIGAPRFANHIMDTMVLAFKDWVEDDKFTKILKEPIFESRETEELVEENTTESSPLRLMINDVLAPFLLLRIAEAHPSFFDRFRRPEKADNHPSSGYLDSRARNKRLGRPIPAPPVPGNLPKVYSNHSKLQYSSDSIDRFPDMHTNRPVPTESQTPTPQHQPWNPNLLQTPHPPPRSRLNFTLRRQPQSENMDMEFMRPENLRKIWHEPRCKYHIHEKGQDCSHEE